MIRNVCYCLALAACVLCKTVVGATIPATTAVPLAIVDQRAPGTSEKFRTISLPSIDADGNVCFLGELNAFAVGRRGIWAGRAGKLQIAAREGQSAPGAPAGTTFYSMFFTEPQLRAGGQVGFYADTFDAGDGVWVGPSGDLALAALSGTPAPGTALPFDDFFFADIATGANRQVAFNSYTADLTNQSIWAGTPGAIQLAAQIGAPAPGRADQ